MADTGNPQAGIDAKLGAGSGVTRKEFSTAGAVGVGAVMGALIALPVTGMALGPVVGGSKFEPVKLGNLDEFVEGSFVKVVLEPGKDDHDAYVKKRVAFVRKNGSKDADKLAPADQWEYSVISNRCVHLGCPVQETGSGFVCPCHGGAYNADGKRDAGPPVRPLDRFRWEVRDGALWAVGEYSLSQNGKAVDVRGPGQATDAPFSLLYPVQPSSL